MILVCILSYCRAPYLEQTLASFTELNGELINTDLVLIALDQAVESSTSAVFDRFGRFFDRVFITDKNLGIGWGFSQLVELSQLYSPEFILFLEDDWLCRVPLGKYLVRINRLFRQHPDLGTLRLRNAIDPVAAVNHVTNEAISTVEWGSCFLIGNYHYVFNPHIVRADVARRLIPTSGEHDAQIHYHRQNLRGAQLLDGMFDHIGHERAPARISRVARPFNIVSHQFCLHNKSFFSRIPLENLENNLKP